MKVFEIFIEDSEEGEKCIVEAIPISFNEDTVIGVLTSVLYAFLSAIPNGEQEQFLADINERFSKEMREGTLLKNSFIE